MIIFAVHHKRIFIPTKTSPSAVFAGEGAIVGNGSISVKDEALLKNRIPYSMRYQKIGMLSWKNDSSQFVLVFTSYF